MTQPKKFNLVRIKFGAARKIEFSADLIWRFLPILPFAPNFLRVKISPLKVVNFRLLFAKVGNKCETITSTKSTTRNVFFSPQTPSGKM